MSQTISLSRGTAAFYGSRYAARAFREDIQSSLMYEPEVHIDFSNVSVGTSFLDELVGGLIISHGGAVLGRLVFDNCDEDTRDLLEFVVTSRLSEQAEIIKNQESA